MKGKLFFGTQTGTAQLVADQILAALPDLISESKNIYGCKIEELQECDFLLLGGSTWGDGELSDDWADYLPKLAKVDFTGKKVALFALGDAVGYGYNFVSAMKILYDEVLKLGGTIIGANVSTEGFEYDHSEAVVDGHFVGLVVDEVNEPDLTNTRIEAWGKTLRAELGLVTA